MAEASRTTWPEWAKRPVMCHVCGERVILKQAHRSFWSEPDQAGRIWHTACDWWRVRVVVEHAR